MRVRLHSALLATTAAAALFVGACSADDAPEAPAPADSESTSEEASPAITAGSEQETTAEEAPTREVEVGEHALPGLITMPTGEPQGIVVLFLWGSGPHDMDGTIGAADNKIFRDMTDGLAEHGIASLRFAKRTQAAPESFDPATSTLEEEYFADTRAAVDLLVNDPELEDHMIFVAGHSQGGMVLPEVLSQNADVVGGISLAGTPRSLFDVLYEQQEDALERQGLPEDQLEGRLATQRETMDLAKAIDSPDDELPLLLNGSGMSAAWIASLNALDPAETAQALGVPMLFLHGEADQQVFFEEDFGAWQDALEGKGNVEFKSYPGLNHFFWESQGLPPIQDLDAPATVDQQVIDDMAAWLIANA